MLKLCFPIFERYDFMGNFFVQKNRSVAAEAAAG